MDEHKCLHEVDFGKIEGHLATIASAQIRIEARQTKVLDKMFGNGGEGMVTSIALLKQGVKRQWWILSILLTAIAGVAFIGFR